MVKVLDRDRAVPFLDLIQVGGKQVALLLKGFPVGAGLQFLGLEGDLAGEPVADGRQHPEQVAAALLHPLHPAAFGIEGVQRLARRLKRLRGIEAAVLGKGDKGKFLRPPRFLIEDGICPLAVQLPLKLRQTGKELFPAGIVQLQLIDVHLPEGVKDDLPPEGRGDAFVGGHHRLAEVGPFGGEDGRLPLLFGSGKEV